MTGPHDSPDLLTPHPQRGEGVRRLNRVPLMIAMAILVIIAGTIAYTYHARLQRAVEANGGQSANAIAALRGIPEAGYIPPKAPDTIPIPVPQPPLPRLRRRQSPKNRIPTAGPGNSTTSTWRSCAKRVSRSRWLRSTRRLPCLVPQSTRRPAARPRSRRACRPPNSSQDTP